jgi:hypothetical protein
MCKGWRVTTFSLILLISTTRNGQLSHAQASDSASASSIASAERLKAWLTASGLADKLDYVRIGVGPNPDPKFALDGMIQHLEFRFVTAGSDQTEEAARFEKLLADYQRDHASALPEKLLYLFVDTFAIEPQNACVDLHLLDSVYSVYLSRSDGSLVVSKVARAAFDTFSVTIPTVAPQEQFRTHLGKQSTPDPKAVRDAIEKFLRTYLASVQVKGGPTPEIITDARRQDGFLRMFVNGAKGVVTDGYWEWMDIAVLFHPEAAAGQGQDTQWDFVCNVEVKYASSPREAHPTDADLDYARRVAQFRTQLNQKLQASLEKGIHD